jgi:hypothetical protein
LRHFELACRLGLEIGLLAGGVGEQSGFRACRLSFLLFLCGDGELDAALSEAGVLGLLAEAFFLQFDARSFADALGVLLFGFAFDDLGVPVLLGRGDDGRVELRFVEFLLLDLEGDAGADFRLFSLDGLGIEFGRALGFGDLRRDGNDRRARLDLRLVVGDGHVALALSVRNVLLRLRLSDFAGLLRRG